MCHLLINNNNNNNNNNNYNGLLTDPLGGSSLLNYNNYNNYYKINQIEIHYSDLFTKLNIFHHIISNKSTVSYDFLFASFVRCVCEKHPFFPSEWRTFYLAF